MKDADASINCNCARKAILKYAIFDACADDEADVAAQIQWRTFSAKSNKARPVKPGTGEELSDYWTNILSELPFSGWLSALDGVPRSQTATKKQKTMTRPPNVAVARREDLPYGLNGLRKTQPFNDCRMVTENEPFTFYQDSEAYIKSYQLSKRLITSFKPRNVPQKVSDASEPNRTASLEQPLDAPDQLPVSQAPENAGLHLHIARMLKSLLAESWSKEDLDTSVKQAQNTWYQHLCCEITRLEDRDTGTSKIPEANTPESETAEISVIGSVAKKNSKYRATSRLGSDASKGSVKVVNCEVFPSIDAITAGRISAGYNSRKRHSNETPDKKSIRSRSARWLNVFSLMGNTRMTVGENNMSQVFVGPQRQLTTINAGAQPRELKFMRTMAELMKEYDRAQKPDSSDRSFDGSSEPV